MPLVDWPLVTRYTSLNKILIFGNSGSGKSTLARKLAQDKGLAQLDLDTLAWRPVTPPERALLAESQAAIEAFMASRDNWVIEGCYADLLGIAAPHATLAIYMNLPVALCVENARRRPWEPHKYATKAEQDKNLEMLIEWIAQYSTRHDEFSESAHEKLYADFVGKKRMYTSNDRNTNLLSDIPDDLREEVFTELLRANNVRIERIVSNGHSSPASGWYDQAEHEWVVVLQGEASVAFESGDEVHLQAGSHLNIPAHTKHRVAWTTPDTATIWLAIHYK